MRAAKAEPRSAPIITTMATASDNSPALTKDVVSRIVAVVLCNTTAEATPQEKDLNREPEAEQIKVLIFEE